MTNKPSAQYSIRAGSENIAMQTNIPPLILVGRDTIHLALKDYRERIMLVVQAASSLSFFLSSLAVVLTSNGYNDFLVSGQRWETIYPLICFVSAVWLLVVCIKLFRVRRKLSDTYALEQICIARQEDVPISVRTDSNYRSTPLN